MSLENWIQGDDGLRKVDFEHHNFGGAEEDFVDPAYDLAGAIHALGLDGLGEDQLLDEYIRRTGDGAVRERLIVYKLRLGLRELDRAAGTLERPLGADRHRVADRRFLAAREFLNRHVSVHNSRRIETPSAPQWSERLIALDLDGVFDSQVLGYFPHTTPAALGALALLRAYGYCVVVNSGRSVDEVRLFCETYGLAGGFAEYGSIFIDRVAQREEILFGADVEKELRRCRALLAQRANWYCDPAIMSEGQFQAIEVIDTPASTYFVPKGHDKGSAIAGLAARIGLGASWIAGVGDSDQDKPMLEQVDLGFAVGNASPNLKALARSAAHVHLMAKPQQQGLLQAVVHLLVRREGLNADVAMRKARSHVKPSTHPLDLALEALDGSSLDRLRTVLGSLSR
jgi:hydroxymethylpyrimidine pyrophosphatase-like HAD family hydrolase